jgi:UPF0716 protein FxsA
MLVLVVLFVVLPLVELAVLVQVADGIGVGNTILLLLGVSIVGSWLCKREGVGVLRRIQQGLDRYELPTKELADGGLILLAGALLITPGFVTDMLGVLLLVPPTRAVFRTMLLAVLARRASITVVTGAAGAAGRRRGPDAPGVIDTTGSE